MNPISLRAAFLACCFVIALVPRPAEEEVKHFGLTATDRFRFCAASVFGKPILTDIERDDLFGPMCQHGETREALKKALVSNGISVFEDSQFVYLTFGRGTQTQEFSVSWLAMNGRVLPPGCRALTPEALDDVGRAVLHEARMPDFPLPYAPQNEPIKAKLFLVLNECELKVGTESVVGVLGGTRLVYGEMRDGTFRFLWDSPLFGLLHNAGYISELRDMNGDGVKEILVTYNASGASESYDGLAIFDIDGNELDPGNDSLIGESFRYETREDGKVDVLVVNNERTDRYKLVNGHYVQEKLSKQSQRKRQAQPPKP
jgi:hypothetical protein